MRRKRKQRLSPKKRKPPFTIAAAVVGIAATAYGVASSASADKYTSQSTSKQEYPQETKDLFSDVEKPMLTGSTAEQSGILSPLLAGSPYAQFLMQQYGKSAGANANAAVGQGAKTAGVSDTGQAQLDLEGLPPVLLNALKQLAFQNASQRTTAVPAGYGNFLAPGQTSQTTGGRDIDPTTTGFQLAGGLTNLAGSVYQNTQQ